MDSAWYPYIVLAIGILVHLVKNEKYRFRNVPAVGSTLPIISYLSAFKYLFHGHEMIQEGYNKYKDSAFKVPEMARWQIIVSGPKLTDEVRRAPDDVLSFRESIIESLQTRITMGPRYFKHHVQVNVIRTQLTRNISLVFDAVRDELKTAFSEVIPESDDWIAFPAVDSIMQVVCRTSNRVFVGLPLCRDPEYISLGVGYTMDLVKAGMILHMFPSVLRPIIGKLSVNVLPSIKAGIRLLGPVIDKRRKELELHGEKWADKPNDAVTWLLEEREGDDNSTDAVVVRILGMNFAAIHTSSMSFTHSLFYLASNPEYARVMREEVETIIKQDGWTKAAVQKMDKVDSFLRESQRMSGLGAITMSRKVMKDFTLSDGTFLPAGSMVGVASRAVHHDSEYYEDPYLFKPWRFSEMRQHEGQHTKYQMVNTSMEFVSFGHGKHACPGRFFAVNELKTMMAHLLLTYDVKLEQDGVMPEPLWFRHVLRPNPTAKVLFRKRKSETQA